MTETFSYFFWAGFQITLQQVMAIESRSKEVNFFLFSRSSSTLSSSTFLWLSSKMHKDKKKCFHAGLHFAPSFLYRQGKKEAGPQKSLNPKSSNCQALSSIVEYARQFWKQFQKFALIVNPKMALWLPFFRLDRPQSDAT